jgi:hypothetical protein
MRTTQGQAAFGHNVQAIITYYHMVTYFSIGTSGRGFSMRVERILFGLLTPTNRFVTNFFVIFELFGQS